jgi:hypothetical protein
MGTIVVGKLESGHIRKGEMLLLMLNRDEVEVVAMYNELEEEVNVARLWRQRAHPSAWCWGRRYQPWVRPHQLDETWAVHAVRQFEA